MSKIVGFLAESVTNIPYNKIFKSALKHRVYIIDPDDKKLCEIHKNALIGLQKDEWK